MNDERLAHLRTLAEAATPGPWACGADEDDCTWYHLAETTSQDVYVQVWALDPSAYRKRDARVVENAQFIAGTSPDVVLELLDEIGRLRAVAAATAPFADAVSRAIDYFIDSDTYDDDAVLWDKVHPTYGEARALVRAWVDVKGGAS